MSLLRRRNLTCFYCSSRSAQSQDGKVRQFKCEHCEADNYLDKNGQITDPPPPSTPTPSNSFRYAHIPTRDTSPPGFSLTSDIFCKTCLKNQHMLKENLASYLPSDDSPRYHEYEASFDTYRRKLEERYPQVCADCAPRAREQIKRSGYIAKTDHLRRMVERTRTVGIGQLGRGGWRGLVIRIGGLGWWGSAVTQISWHLLATVRREVPEATNSQMTDELGGNGLPRFGRCARLLVYEQHIDERCLTGITHWMPAVLALALATTWWNNQIRQKYLYNGGRMVGLRDYYTLQVIILAARVVAFWMSISPTTMTLDGEVLKGLHIFMAIFLALSTLISSTLVRLDTASRVSFHTDDNLLLPNAPTSTAADPRTAIASSRRPFPTTTDTFPIANLAPTPTSSYRPPTPPPEVNYNDPDEMDWTPSTKQANPFNPRSRALPVSAYAGPSPFRGTLPPAPMAPAHKLRRPANLAPGAFKRASPLARENFFAGLSSKRNRVNDDDDTVSDFSSTNVEASDDDEERSATAATRRKGKQRREMKMAGPRFFAKEDAVDTGLEGLFDEVFSIGDTPRGIRSVGEQQGLGRDRPTGRGIFEMTKTGSTGKIGTGSLASGSWGNTLVVVMVPMAILVAVAAWVKGVGLS